MITPLAGPDTDLVTQMHNARGAFYKHASACKCGFKPRLQQWVPSIAGMATLWRMRCDGCGLATKYEPTPGEAAHGWEQVRETSTTTGECHGTA